MSPARSFWRRRPRNCTELVNALFRTHKYCGWAYDSDRRWSRRTSSEPEQAPHTSAQRQTHATCRAGSEVLPALQGMSNGPALEKEQDGNGNNLGSSHRRTTLRKPQQALRGRNCESCGTSQQEAPRCKSREC